MRETIISNKAQCRLCGDIVESLHRHDYKSCKCGNMSVDGGKSYLKRSYRESNSIIELSEVVQDDLQKLLLEKDEGAV